MLIAVKNVFRREYYKCNLYMLSNFRPQTSIGYKKTFLSAITFFMLQNGTLPML